MTRDPGSAPRPPVDAFFATTSYHDASFSADGARVLVSANESGVFNAYAVPAAGGAPEALTASTTDAVYAVSYFPHDGRALVTHDRGGDEHYHLYVREPGGRLHDLTPGGRLRAGFLNWSAAGDRFWATTNARDAAAADVYEWAADGYARTLVYENPGGFRPAAVSPDGRRVALGRAAGVGDSDVYVLDRHTGRLDCVTPHGGAGEHVAAAFAADGGALYLTTDHGGEFAWLERLDLETGERAVVCAPPWDVTGAVASPDGGCLAVLVNADARGELRLFALPGLRELPSPAPPGASVAGRPAFSRDGRRVAFYASTARAPNDLYVAEVGAESAARVTASLDPRLDAAGLVESRVARFRARDGVEVPGILYLPHGATPARPAPGVVMVHGGPGGQARLGWNPVAQLLASYGYAVYDVNHRGSSGYGRAFYAMDVRRQGEADLADVVEARELLAATGVVDARRVAVMGASYGGFLVLAALAWHPEAFAAGVDLFGPADWGRTLASLPAWLGAQRLALYAKTGDPEEDAARMRGVSPLFAAGRIRRPLLVLQGANDARVPRRESDEVVAAARAGGAPVEYLVFEGEGHGFARREHLVRGYAAVVAFLERYV